MCWCKTSIGLVGLLLLLFAGNAKGQTITVTISDDIVDIDWTSATIDDLPGPDGEISFSEALIAANNTPGHQTIGFAIPQSDWQLQFLLPGRAVLTSITGFFFRADDEVTIDGTTQTAFTGNTNPNGGEVAIYGNDLFINAANSTLIGFDSTSVFVGSDTLVQGNTGSMNVTVNGSRTRVEGNSGGTIAITGDDNVVVGNTVLRMRLLSGNNNIIGGPNPEDRNFLTGYGTWNISSGLPSGTTLQVTGTVGTVIENNYIGTTPDGLAQGNPASTIGVSIEGTNDDLIVRDNLIAGIKAIGIKTWAGFQFGNAVLFWGSGGGTNIEISGNTIGLDATGEPLLGSVWGIDVGNVNGAGNYSGVRIERNVVAGHTLNGITVGSQVADARISENSIFENGLIGIDLIPTSSGIGVTPNDPLDPDPGANGLQNFPDLTSASVQGGSTRIVGSLNSESLTFFTLEFFASPVCDSSGFGEGEVFLGRTTVFTDSNGDADFDVSLSTSVSEDWVVTSTATLEPTGATSEFSACIDIGVTTVEIVDNGDPGYMTATTSGVWNTFGAGFQGDIDWTEPGQGDTATWTFAVAPGSTQRVSATWFNHATLASDASFEIFDGTTSLGTFSVNQQVAPSGFPDAGATWDDLTAGVTISSGTLTVVLSDVANGRVAADAIRIELVDPSIQIIDNGDANYASTSAGGVWNTFGAGFQSDIDWTEPGQGDTASWTFTVTPGDYQVSATWFNHSTLATNAAFEIFDGATSLGVFNVNQQIAPSQFSEAGANWDDLSESVSISSGTLTVQLSDLANGRVAADAIRIAAASPDTGG